MKKLVSALVLVYLWSSPMRAQVAVASISTVFSDTSLFHCSPVSFNSSQSDLGVTSCSGMYVFSSARESRMPVHYFNDGPLYDLYYVRRIDSCSYTSPRVFASELRSKENEGPVAINRTGDKMILTGNNPALAPGQTDHSLALFESVNVNGRWKEGQLLPFCSAGYNYGHAAFVNDSVLFFISDCPGGMGGKDIWITQRDANGWSQPVNAGRHINTSSDEVFPFISSEEVLYFSSNRPGSDGLDIYACSLSDTSFGLPVRLEGEINSEADDFSFWMHESASEGFFSSNRGNTHDDNIYSFRIQWPSVNTVDTLVAPQLCFSFYEEATERTQDTVLMKYTWTFDDAEVLYGYSVYKCFDTIGEYHILLEVRDSSGGDLVISNTDYYFDVPSPCYVSYVVPDSIHAQEQFLVDTRNSFVDGYEIQAVQYDFGNGQKCTGPAAAHTYYEPGIYYPRVYFQLKNKTTGITETRCVVKKLIVLAS